MRDHMTTLFRELWLKQHPPANLERLVSLGFPELEYHIDLGQQLSYSNLFGKVTRVYREIFGLDGFDYGLEHDVDELEEEARQRRILPAAMRMIKLRAAISLYTAFPSDMHTPHISWVRDWWPEIGVLRANPWFNPVMDLKPCAESWRTFDVRP